MTIFVREGWPFLVALVALGLAGCATTGPAADERYGPVENWPSYQAMQNLGRGD